MDTEATVPAPPVDDATARRIARARQYLGEHLEDQRGWYDRKASRYKRWAQWLAFIVLAAGGLTTLVQIFPAETAPNVATIVTCLLGLIVVLAKGLNV